MTAHYARRFHTRPNSDEHAAVCEVLIYEGQNWNDAKDAVIAYLTKTVQAHTKRGNTVRRQGIAVTDSYDKLVASETEALHTAIRWDQDKPNGSSGNWWYADAGDIRYRLV